MRFDITHPAVQKALAKEGRQAKVRARRKPSHVHGHVTGRMNKTEALYARLLDLRKAAGEISLWRFEAVKFRLADRTYYTPDFMVTEPGGIKFVEVKGGFTREDSWIKLKLAAELFPMFAWELAQWKGGAWETVMERKAA